MVLTVEVLCAQVWRKEKQKCKQETAKMFKKKKTLSRAKMEKKISQIQKESHRTSQHKHKEI